MLGQIIRRPEIYVLDDSFQHLIIKRMQNFVQELKKKQLDPAVLIVAQRVGTIMHADKIIVLNEGEVVEYGRTS